MKIEFYEDRREEHRWRIIARNGKIIAASNEGFADQRWARNNARLVKRAFEAITISPKGDGSPKEPKQPENQPEKDA